MNDSKTFRHRYWNVVACPNTVGIQVDRDADHVVRVNETMFDKMTKPQIRAMVDPVISNAEG